MTRPRTLFDAGAGPALTCQPWRFFLLPLLIAALALVSAPRPVLAAQYTLSGSPDGTASIGVDDDLDIYRNTTQIYTDGTAAAGARPPIPVTADIGDELRFVVRDTFGICSGLAGIYLTDAQGRGTLADPGFDLGCGRPNSDQGVVHDRLFVIPDLSIDPAYLERTLPGSAFAGVIPGPGGFLYGVTYDGGSNNAGTLYKTPPDLSTVTTIHHFNSATEGAVPYYELIVGTGTAAGRLFGTTNTGGSGGGGTVFSFDPASNVLTTLLAFGVFGPSSPSGPLLQIGDYLYGGTHGTNPVVYRVLTNGSAYQALHTFDVSEGENLGALTLGPDGYLYGTAFYGGDTTCYTQPKLVFGF